MSRAASACTDCGTTDEIHHHNCATHERWARGEERIDRIAQSDASGDHYPKQARYQDAQGDDWIDEFARTATADEFRGAMRFTIGKYNRRAGKKDELTSEIRKMRDYCDRWLAYEEGGA